jgi:hypothetical protein
VQQADELLAVDLLELGVVVADAGLRGEGVAAATKVQVIAGGGAVADVIAPEESRRLALVRRPPLKVRPSSSWLVSRPPWKVEASRRVSLYTTTGRIGCRVPRRRVLLDTRTLPVRPSSL